MIDEDDQVLEDAAWIGKTGLAEEVERELPRYIRREMGQSIHEDCSLKANDLHYLGVFPWKSYTVHYWRTRVPGEDEDTYATIVMHEGIANYGWGSPPPDAP